MSEHIDIEKYQHIYFLGIGGIGMSAVARYLHHKGIRISGYDRDRTELTKTLEALGMEIHYEDSVDLVPTDIDMVVYTPAIPHDMGERVCLEQQDIPMLKRSETLKVILAQKRVIAVSGTHGKTSTSAILAHILHSQGLEVSAFVGGIMSNYGTNFIYGDSDWVVVEADEYDRSFLRLYPDLAIVNAMDADHLDIYGERGNLVQSFDDFLGQVKDGGTIWVRDSIDDFWSDEQWRERLESRGVAVRSFGTGEESDIRLSGLEQSAGTTSVTIAQDDSLINSESIMPGLHNAVNTTAAAAVALHLGLTSDQIADGIATFAGIQRRFEVLHASDELVMIDDYAHHPVEITAAIRAARSHYPDRRLTVAFQPHLYTRTRDFREGFAEALDLADEVYLIPIYPARELPIEGVTSESILDLMSIDDKKIVAKEELINHLDKDQLEVLMILGAGDIYKLIPEIKSKLLNEK